MSRTSRAKARVLRRRRWMTASEVGFPAGTCPAAAVFSVVMRDPSPGAPRMGEPPPRVAHSEGGDCLCEPIRGCLSAGARNDETPDRVVRGFGESPAKTRRQLPRFSLILAFLPRRLRR